MACRVNDIYYKDNLSKIYRHLPDSVSSLRLSLRIGFYIKKLIVRMDKFIMDNIVSNLKIINFARIKIDTPSDCLTPKMFVNLTTDFIKTLSLQNKIKITIFNEQELIKQNFTSMLSVAKGSRTEPMMLMLEYNGNKEKTSMIYGVAGKGITYDSGGMNIKVNDYMRDMKLDMSGAATSVAIVLYAALNNLTINLCVVSGLCENMLNDVSYRPGDIVITKGNKTVEVDNTDAEGRMVLIDLIEYLQNIKNIKNICTFATLTGQIRRFFHNFTLPILSNDEKIISILKSLEHRGNYGKLNVCSLPFDRRYLKSMKANTVANIRNCGHIASSISAGMFLHFFARDDVKFSHFDIACVAFNEKRHLSENLHYDIVFKMFKKLSK